VCARTLSSTRYRRGGAYAQRRGWLGRERVSRAECCQPGRASQPPALLVYVYVYIICVTKNLQISHAGRGVQPERRHCSANSLFWLRTACSCLQYYYYYYYYYYCTRIPILYAYILQLVETTLWCCCCVEAARIPTGDLLSQVRGVRVRACDDRSLPAPLRCRRFYFICDCRPQHHVAPTILPSNRVLLATSDFKTRVVLNSFLHRLVIYIISHYSVFAVIFRIICCVLITAAAASRRVHLYILIVRI